MRHLAVWMFGLVLRGLPVVRLILRRAVETAAIAEGPLVDGTLLGGISQSQFLISKVQLHFQFLQRLY